MHQKHMWIEENAAALSAGSSIYELPHILGGFGAGGGLQRMMIWTAAAWPPIFLMLTSKVKYHKTLGWACLPPAIFTVVEPVVFGLPLAHAIFSCASHEIEFIRTDKGDDMVDAKGIKSARM